MVENAGLKCGESKALLGKSSDGSASFVSVDSGEIPPSYSSLMHGRDDHQCNGPHTDKLSVSILNGGSKFLLLSVGSLVLMSLHLLYQHSSSIIPQKEMLQMSHHHGEDQSLQKQPFGFEDAFSSITNEPLSYKSPAELGIPVYNERPADSLPGSVFGHAQKGSKIGIPLPTNEWYLNLIVGLDDNPGEDGKYANYAGEENRVHSIPYIIDTVGTFVGIRLHYPNIVSYGTVVQSAFVPWQGLTLGTADDEFTRKYQVDAETLPSKLGIGIRWEKEHESHQYIRSSILRGMPYGTMEYASGVKPVIASEVVGETPIIDASDELLCGKLDPHNGKILQTEGRMIARKDIELYFPESDFTWFVFFSRPVYVRCFINPNKGAGTVSLPPGAASSSDNPNAFELRLEDIKVTDEPLIVRVALANNCTSGTNVNFCDHYTPRDQSKFMSVLREHSSVYPTAPSVKYSFSDPGR